MYRGKRILGLVCARGGSIGLPKKNLLPFGGKPMIAHAISNLLALPEIDRVVVSSDCPEILDCARKFGADTPFVRPTELASATAPTAPVVLHCLTALAPDTFDYLVLAQATSPLTRSIDIQKGLHKVIDENLDVVFSVATCSHPPQWTLRCGHTIEYAFPMELDRMPTRRQDMEVLYRSTGAFSCVSIKHFVSSYPHVLLCLPEKGQQTGVIMTSSETAVDIDTFEDYLAAQSILKYKSGEMVF